MKLLFVYSTLLATSIASQWESNDISSQDVVKLQPERYLPNWASLDARPLPVWYDAAKVGIFLHWGLFSVPSYSSAWFWYNWRTYKYDFLVNFMSKNYKPGFTYPVKMLFYSVHKNCHIYTLYLCA